MKTYHVISHTHWDREWYQPFEQMRHRLVDMMDNLIEIYQKYPNYIFHLDAQTICLEDYLEIRPYRKAELKKYIRSGNILVGPWYVQNDFFLTSGESTIRNLLVGTSIADEFGACETVGYVPDQFGLISQLPQIFRGFGIDCCVFGRGYREYSPGKDGRYEPQIQPNEFNWTSPDGSTVFASFMNCWYNNAQRFSEDIDRAFKQLQYISSGQDAQSVTPHRLLMNGVDHMEAQENLLPILEKLNSRLNGEDTISQSTLRRFINAAREYINQSGIHMHSVSGELRKGVSGEILQGTLASWTPLKRENARAQAMLEMKIEPLFSMICALAGNPDLYDRDYMTYLWKSLLKNHPHDSICGCSRSRVHEDNMNRFARLQDCTTDVLQRGTKQVLDRIDRRNMNKDNYLLCVFNTMPYQRSEIIPCKLFLPLQDKIESIRIVRPDGKDADFEISRSGLRQKAFFTPINLPGQIPCAELDIHLEANDIPACGYAVYEIVPGKGKNIHSIGGPAAFRVIENEFLKVEATERGSVNITDKSSGMFYPGAIEFIDEINLGDGYHFAPRPQGGHINIGDIAKTTIKPGPGGLLKQAIKVEHVFELPASYNFKKHASSEEMKPCVISTVYSLSRSSRRVDVEVTIENHSEDHRLRVLFHSGVDTDVSTSSTPFDFITRSRKDAHNGIKHNGDQPNCGIVTLEDGTRQFTVLNEGLYEYEHLEDDAIALTLLRCFGRIANENYPEQQESEFVSEAYEFECHASQMHGTHNFRFAVRPGFAQLNTLENEYREFLNPIFSCFDSADDKKFATGRQCVQSTDLQEFFFRDLPENDRRLPTVNSALEVSGNIIVSAFKMAEDGADFILRLFNPSGKSEHACIRLPPRTKSARMVSLDEKKHSTPLDIKRGLIDLDIKRGGIISIKLTLSSGAQ